MTFFLNEILEDNCIKELLLEDKETAEEGRKIAEEMIETGMIPSPEAGFLPIFILAYLADHALEKNSARGIPREITVTTLKDINIWLRNYEIQFGKKGLGEFDWLCNHYTGDLFRLGRLQFRLEKSLTGVPSGAFAIETHIPQGEPLNTEDCLDSFALARTFFAEYFPEQKADYFMCDSWLLNPNLAHVLPADSNIVRFMRLWDTFDFPGDGSSQAVERIFGLGFKKERLSEAPEHTSLQKAAKAYLLSDGQLNITGGCRPNT